MPKVSVIITTYNRAYLINEAIESVLNQTFCDFELIVVDDGSTDNTKDALCAYSGKISYIHQENKGRAFARNNGIEHAKGEYVAFLDDDDIWLPRKLEKQIDFFRANLDAGLVHSLSEKIDMDGHHIKKETKRHLRSYRKALDIGYTYEGMTKLCAILISTVMIRKECFEKVGLFDKNTETFEDWDFYLRLSLKYRIAFIEEPLAKVRLHRAQTSRPEFSRGRINVCLKHLNLGRTLFSHAVLRRINFNLYRHLATAYYMESYSSECRRYILKALRENPMALFSIGSRLLLSLVLPSLVKQARSLKGGSKQDKADLHPERIIPAQTTGGPLAEHWKRYQFAKLFCKDKIVLDVACGVGYGSAILAEVAKRVVGVDVSSEAIEYARNHYQRENIEFMVMDANDLKFPRNYFDVVSSYETLEHLDEPKRFLSEVRRVLNKEGTFLVSTPYANKTDYAPKNPYHKTEFSLRDFDKLLKKYFINAEIMGQRRLQSVLHAWFQKIDIFHLRSQLPISIRRGICRLAKTSSWREATIDDFVISNKDLKKAKELIGVCSLPVPFAQQAEVSIVIVSHNCKDLIINCVKSIYDKSADILKEIIVVDNDSRDGTLEAIRGSFPEVKVIKNSENRWFRAANNQGIRASRGRYVLLLNPDTIILTNDAIGKMARYMDDHMEIGILGAKLINPDGTTQIDCNRFPGLLWVLFYYFLMHNIWPGNPVRRHWRYDGWNRNDTRAVDYVSGACMMVRKAVFDEIDLFDEECLIYWDEPEFGRAAHNAGWQTIHLSEVEVLHHIGRGGTKANSPNQCSRILERSMLHYYRKYYGTGIYLILLMIYNLRRYFISLMKSAKVMRN
ncbi:MAG: glycosyltransferase [Candidatus Omnitrophica bacterium]|nr:glycosyltransferase [Candidatus Omnitrophota bacterium]MDD5553092.1 glycosyltransferase [Candidatus Omnitrophota bacterium]